MTLILTLLYIFAFDHTSPDISWVCVSTRKILCQARLLPISFPILAFFFPFVLIRNNYTGLIITRLFLGAVESGFFPILSVYLTEFYKRSELGLRSSYLFVSAAISGAFGGLIASGVFDGLNGRYGVSGWRWLYHIGEFERKRSFSWFRSATDFNSILSQREPSLSDLESWATSFWQIHSRMLGEFRSSAFESLLPLHFSRISPYHERSRNPKLT